MSTEEPSAAGGVIKVTDAAALAGLVKPKSIRAFRDHLVRRHKEEGDCLYRYSDAPNAQLWTTWRILKREFKAIFGEPEDLSGLDLLELRQGFIDLRKRVERLEMGPRRKVSPK